MAFLGFSGLVNCITCIFLGIFVLLKNIKSIQNRSYFILNFSVALYSFGYFFWQLAQTESIALFWFKLLVFGIILINIAYLLFVFAFVDILGRKKRLLITCFTINIIFIALNLTSRLYTHLEPRYNLGFWPVPTIFFHIYLAFWFWQMFYGFYWLLKGLRKYTGLRREQIKYFTFAAIFGFVGGATNWPMWYKIHLPPYPNILISVYVGVVAYAIVKYRLMDVRVAVSRAAIFGFVYTIVLGIPFGIGYFLRGRGVWFLPLIFMALFATAGPFVFFYFQRKAEDRIFKNQRIYQQKLRQTINEISAIPGLDKLSGLLLDVLTTSLGIEHTALYLRDRVTDNYKLKLIRGNKSSSLSNSIERLNPLIQFILERKKPLVLEELSKEYQDQPANSKLKEAINQSKSLDAAVVLPCFFADDLVGFFILGNKPSKEMYTQDDLDLLSILAGQTAMSIDREVMQEKISQAKRIGALGDMLDCLNHEIGNLLNNISIPIQMLQMGSFKTKQRQQEAIDSIVENIITMSQLLKTARSYQEKSKTDQAQAYNIEDTINTILQNLEPKLKSANIQLTKQIQPHLSEFKGKTTLPDLFTNLFTNCYYSMREKQKGNLDITLSKQQNKDFIEARISDTGGDLLASAQKRSASGGQLFGMRGKLGGLNYFLANAITQQHNGTLSLESNQGIGTTFIIQLPIS